MVRRIVVIGAGPAGLAAALAARRQAPADEIVLLSAEHGEPYEKPPLSKEVLLGKSDPGATPIVAPGSITAAGIRFLPASRVSALDRDDRLVRLEVGPPLPYDALVLATGAVPRRLPVLPGGTAGVFYLRDAADAGRLRAALDDRDRLPRVAVVGAGLIGLEVAAAAAARGRETIVLELGERAMMRACTGPVAALVLERHRRAGVEFRFASSVVSAEPVAGGLALTLGDGTVLRVGLAVVGIGIRPDTRLAAAAGLAVDDGILVDDRCRSSDPRIFAAGDVARFGTRWCAGPVRLENWRHALDQGEVAGASAAGGNLAYGAVPSFWSDQYELRLQGVGWPDGLAAPVIRRSLGADRFLDFHLLDGRLRYAVGIGAGREIAIARRLIERRAPLDPLLLVDATKPLQALLRSGA